MWRHGGTGRRRLGIAVVTAAIVLATGSPTAHAEQAGSEVPLCDGHEVMIIGTDGDDVIDGTAGDDVIAGLGGDDVVHGHGGDDAVCGGDGGDLLRGGAGDDRLFGEAQEQFRTGDILIGGAGSDHLDGSGYNADIIRYRARPVMRGAPGIGAAVYVLASRSGLLRMASVRLGLHGMSS